MLQRNHNSSLYLMLSANQRFRSSAPGDHLQPGFAALGICFGAILALTAGSLQAQPPRVPSVAVVPAEHRVVPVTVTLVGTTKPYTRSSIAAEVAGIVEAIPVIEGQRVEAGSLVCELRDDLRRMALEQAERRLGELQAQLAELEAGSRKEEIARAAAELAEAQAIEEKWRLELVRISSLRERNSASDKEYNDTVAEEKAARQRTVRAKASYDLVVAGPRVEQIEQARYAVRAQEVAVRQLRYDLEQTRIRAPFCGEVTRRDTEVGQWLPAGGPVLELIELDRILVRVDVPESAVFALSPGDRITVIVEALDRTLEGTVERIVPQAEERARTFPVDILLDNSAGRLKSGMFVRAIVPAGPAVESIIVPRDAIIQRAGAHYVVIVAPPPQGQGQMAVPVPVRLGASLGSWVAVSATMLQPGVPVAIKGHDRVYGPQPVEPVPGQVDPPTVRASATARSAATATATAPQ